MFVHRILIKLRCFAFQISFRYCAQFLYDDNGYGYGLIMLILRMFSVTFLSVFTEYHYAEWQYPDYRSARCRYADSHYAEYLNWPTSQVEMRWVLKKRNSLVLIHFNVYCFHFTRNQCLQNCIQISTPLSLASFI